MRILIDECLDWRIARSISGHHCSSVPQMGWSGIKNGRLLSLMEREGFEVFITGDRNLQFQQNLSNARVAVVVLAGHSTQLRDTLPLLVELMTLIPMLQPGTVHVVYP